MSHDATKVLMGTTTSSKRVVTCEPADPTVFPAGTAVRRATTGGLQTADDSTAALIGVSLGKDLSNTAKTSVCRKGLGVPLLLKEYYASLKVGDITFTAKTPGAAGNSITIALVDTETGDTADVSVAEDTTDIVIGISATDPPYTTAQTIVDAIEADPVANALVSCVIDDGDEDAAQNPAAEAPLEDGDDGAAVHGKVVYVNDDGHGCLAADTDAVATGATYNGGKLTGVTEAGTEVAAALVDIVGAL